MSDLNLDEIEARATAAAELAKQATAGPWYAHYGDEVEWDIAHTGAGNDGAENMVSTKSTVSHEETGAQEDAAFIAAARTDVPALAADVQALLAEVKRLRADADKTLQALDMANITINQLYNVRAAK